MNSSQFEHIKSTFTPSNIMTLDDLIRECEKINPTKEPYVDICNIKIIGDYIFILTNHYKWLICSGLATDIIDMTSSMYPILNFNPSIIIDHINTSKLNKSDPQTIKMDIYKYIINIYQSLPVNNYVNIKANPSETSHKNITFRNSYRKNLDSIFSKYESSWKKVQSKFEKHADTFISKFNELETEPDFINIMNIINSITEEASLKTETLINKLFDDYKKAIEICQSLNTPLSNIIKASKLVMDHNDEQLDIQSKQLYHDIIVSKNIPNQYAETLSGIFSTENTMAKMGLTMLYANFSILNCI